MSYVEHCIFDVWRVPLSSVRVRGVRETHVVEQDK